MKHLSLLLLLATYVLVIGCAGEKALVQPGQHSMAFEQMIVQKAEFDYWLYLPEDYGKVDKEWPLMLFLHGVGEVGDDINQVLEHGLPKLASQGESFPFIIISPQCPNGTNWRDEREELLALFDYIADTYDVDKTRLYITGLSMGGFGTWAMIEKYPTKFAAAAPICGGADPDEAERLVDLPIWIFHGEDDDIIPLSFSQEMVDEIKEAGGTKIKFTIYPDTGHNSWSKAYNDPELYEWLLEHTVR